MGRWQEVVMESIEQLLDRCEQSHGHLCAGQLLGVRMAVLGCNLIGITDTRGADRKKLIVWVEIDRCMTDAVSAVTGTRLGKRTLKFLDYGKVAATFLNVDTNEAVRVVARESSRELADQRHPEISAKKVRQMTTYREATDNELFMVQTVDVRLNENDQPGHPKSRVICDECGEGVNDGRELRTVEQGTLCQACAFGAYYQAEAEPVFDSETTYAEKVVFAESL
jgi:formylmethanofuran dehydrogenase subunit E